MLMAGGPIERIYSKIVDCNIQIEEDVLALFEIEDFTLDYDFNIKLKNNASKKLLKWQINYYLKWMVVFQMMNVIPKY